MFPVLVNLLPPVLALLLTSPAAVALPGQPPTEPDLLCLPAGDLVQLLEELYAEAPVARGLGSDGELVIIYVAKTTGTWSLALESPTGVSCIIADGIGFELLPKELAAIW